MQFNELPPNSHAFLTNGFGDGYLYEVNGSTFNVVGARNLFRSHFGSNLTHENTLYIVVGSDSGLLPLFIQNEELPSGTRFIFIEAEPFLPSVLSRAVDQTEKNERLVICNAENWVSHANHFSFNEYAYLGRIELIRSLAVEEARHPAYRDLWNRVEQEFDQLRWKYGTEFGKSVFIQKMLENIAENRIPASTLRSKFKGRFAVILAGGPSLDEVLPWVKENRSKLFVIAASRISRRLQQVELIPDLLVSVDPHDVSFDVSKEALFFSAQTVLAHEYHVNPRILGQWGGRSVYLERRYPWTVEGDEENIAGAPPTVTNSALSLALQMGFSTIVFGGLDLCFSREGFSHAKGSNEHNAGPAISIATQTVTTNDGSIAETENSLFLAISVFEQQAREAKTLNCRLINPAPGAAAVDGIEFIPLARIELPSSNATNLLAELLPEETVASRVECFQSALAEVSRFIHKATQARALAAKGLDCNERLFGRKGAPANFKFKIRMDRVEKQLDGEFKEVSNLCKVLGMAEFVKILLPDTDDRWTDEEVEQMGRTYYSAYLAGAERLLQLLHATEQRLLSRLEEERENANLEKLAKQWRQDFTPGRIRLFRNKHHGRVFSEEEQQLAISLEKDFQSVMEATDTPHMRRSKAWTKLTGIPAKAQACFGGNDSRGLQRIHQSLTKHPDTSEALPLRKLVEGYIAEMNGYIDDAVTAYAEANSNLALENALRRLVSIALDQHDFDNALLALRSLAALSPSYMPQLAELHRMRGEYSEAVGVYTDYLSLAPEDLTVMMRLGLLYRELGVTEGTHLIFDHIISKDPDNKAALQILKEMANSNAT